MKQNLSFLLLGLLCGILYACSGDSIQQETSDTELPSGIDSMANQLDTYDKNVQALIQDPNGLVRGFTLHMNADVVKAKNEGLQKVDSSLNRYTYSVQLDPVEAADYTFEIENNKVSKIEVVVYPENEYKQGVYYRDLRNYFSAKFNTKATEDKNTLHWKVPSQQLHISLSKTGSKKFHDLQLVFEELK